MAERKPTFSWLLHKPLCFLGFGFGSGLSPIAPGTAGTLAALPLAFVLCLLGIDGWILLLLCIALFFWGIRICGYTERELGIQDYGGIVWDEIVAMLLVLSLIPFKWSWWLAAFIIFRLFDALKPWPIKWFDRRIHGGLGIMLDDLIAAAMTLMVLGLFYWIA